MNDKTKRTKSYGKARAPREDWNGELKKKDVYGTKSSKFEIQAAEQFQNMNMENTMDEPLTISQALLLLYNKTSNSVLKDEEMGVQIMNFCVEKWNRLNQ